MKSGRYLLWLFFILFSLPAVAQRGGVDVTGTVVEEGNNEPIEQATVRLLNVKDSTIKKVKFSFKSKKALDFVNNSPTWSVRTLKSVW